MNRVVLGRRLLLPVVALATACAGMVVAASPAGAIASNTVAFWSMDEPPGATTLVDSSGNGRHGTIGSTVTTGAQFQGATGHRYSTILPSEQRAEPGHVDRVNHNTAFNPDTGDFSVTIRFRTDYKFGNILQKGQGSQAGGYWKIENPEGLPRCLFRGGNGASRTGTSNVAVDDGQWHVLRCNRTSTFVEMYIDGVFQSRLTGSTGTISNTANVSIAGKSNCDGTNVTCDYFVGDIDYIRIEKGSSTTPNAAPNANVGVACTGLICSLSGATSTDSDGAIQRYFWNFGDGTTYDGQSVPSTSHKFASAGTYNVALTVTDDRGATNTETRSVTVAPIPEKISFVGQNTSNANATTHQVSVPGGVQAGDTMLLFLSQNTTATRSTPAGWTLRDSIAGGYGRTTVWSRTAAAGDAGDPVAVTLSAASKANMVLAAYRGTDPTSPIADLRRVADTNNTATRLTPVAQVTLAQSWGVSYWMHGDSASTSLTAPGDVAVRSNSSQTGGGRVTGLLADSAASLPTGGYGGLAATGAAASTTGTAWTVILRPADGPPPQNQPPTASFTVSCNALTCSTDASASSDAEGPLTYGWSWGDTTSTNTGTDPTTAHTYATAGDYTIELTVTDDDGETATTSHQVTVEETPVQDVVDFVAAASASNTATSHTVGIPGSVQTSDTLLLFLSVSGLPTVTNPAGWQVLDTQDDGSVRTRVWWRTATAGDAGSSVSVPLGVSSKGNLSVVAYRGTAGTPVLAHASSPGGDSASRTTPTVTVPVSTWVVSYWAHRDSSSTALSVPGIVTSRATGTQSGGGRITTLLADSNANVPSGSYGGLTATAQASSSYGTSWTIVLAPAGP